MLKFIYNHNNQSKKVNITSHVNDKIRFILSNPRTVPMKLTPFMMSLIINFKKFIESLNVRSDVKSTLI